MVDLQYAKPAMPSAERDVEPQMNADTKGIGYRS